MLFPPLLQTLIFKRILLRIVVFGYENSQNRGISIPPLPTSLCVAMETALPLRTRAEAEYILIPAGFTLSLLNRTRHQAF